MAKKKARKKSTAKRKSKAQEIKVLEGQLLSNKVFRQRFVDTMVTEERTAFRKKVDALKEDFPTFFGLAGFAELDPALTGFTRFSQRAISTDLDDQKQDRQYITAVTLYHKTPVARYFANLKVAFLTAGKMGVEAKDENVHDWIQKFLSDPFMKYSLLRKGLAREGVLAGELPVYPNVNKQTGFVRLAYISPGYIKGKPSPVPGFPHMPDRIRLRREALRLLGHIAEKDPKTGKAKVNPESKYDLEILKVIRPRVDPDTLKEQLSGDIFFIPMNRLLTSLRGHSEFLSSADQIDAVDEALFAMIERLYLLNLFVWHITYEGYSEAKIREERRRIERDGGIKPGTTMITNAKAKIEAITGNFGNADFVIGFDKALNVAAMSFGIPQAWLGLGDLVNRASAEVSETPIMKMLQDGRDVFRDAEKLFLEYHVLMGIKHGTLRKVKDASFEISYEELSKTGQTDAANALSTVTGALSVAVVNNWMTQQQATRLVTFIAEQIVKLPAAPLLDTPAADPDQATADPEDPTKAVPQAGANGDQTRSDIRADAAAAAIADEQIEDLQAVKRKRKKPAPSRY